MKGLPCKIGAVNTWSGSVEETRITMEILLEAGGLCRWSLVNQMDSMWKSRLQNTWRGCRKVLGNEEGDWRCRITLRVPLETGPCMRQRSIICPLVTYGGVGTHPALQVFLRHSDSAEESVRFSRFFCTAQEEGLPKTKTCYSLAIWPMCHSQGLPWFCFSKVAQTRIHHVQKVQATEAAGLGSLTPNFPPALAFIRPWGLNKELIYSWLTFCRNKILIHASCPAPYLLLFSLFCKVTFIQSEQRRD